MTKIEYQELASELYERTVDFLNEEVIEMLYDMRLIKDTGNEATYHANKIMHQFFNKQLTKNW
jgi:hypothetical protein